MKEPPPQKKKDKKKKKSNKGHFNKEVRLKKVKLQS